MKYLILVLTAGVIGFTLGFFFKGESNSETDVFNDYGYIVTPVMHGCNVPSKNELGADVLQVKTEKFDLNSRDNYVSGVFIVEHTGSTQKVLQSISDINQSCWQKKSFEAETPELMYSILDKEFNSITQGSVVLIFKEKGKFRVYF